MQKQALPGEKGRVRTETVPRVVVALPTLPHVGVHLHSSTLLHLAAFLVTMAYSCHYCVVLKSKESRHQQRVFALTVAVAPLQLIVLAGAIHYKRSFVGGDARRGQLVAGLRMASRWSFDMRDTSIGALGDALLVL